MYYKLLTNCFLFLFIPIFSFSQSYKQYVKAADKAFGNGDFHTAIIYYEKATIFKKKNDELFYKIGKSQLELKNYNQALKVFSKIKDKSVHPLLNYQIGINYMLIGQYDKAILHFKNFNDDNTQESFYTLDAIQKIASCYWAKDHQKLNKELEVNALNNGINTPYSEFSAGHFKDSLFQATCFHLSEEDELNYTAEIFFFRKENEQFIKEDFELEIDKKMEAANGFYLEEKKRFYFNQCKNNDKGGKTCALYLTQFADSTWSKPVALNINEKEFTYTQATAFVDESGKDVLFFASNKGGGYGKNDIWMAKEIEFAVFEKPVVLPQNINSINDEASPFYDKQSGMLYFSSKWHYGYGGFDIFKVNYKDSLAKPINLGQPYNSSADDLYYVHEKSNQKSFFSSNRKGALLLKGSACCYDIFSIAPKLEIPVDSLNTLDSLVLAHRNDSTSILLQKIRSMLPITVYFHNDEPNPKSIDTTTSIDYIQAYQSFYSLQNEYEYNNFEHKKQLKDFFYNKLYLGKKQLESFSKLLDTLAQQGIKLKIELSGYASPLAENVYNKKLTKRRIASIENYLKNYKNLAQAIVLKNLILTEIPYGEEKSNQNVSADYNKPALSVYSTQAALERKVSILAIELK